MRKLQLHWQILIAIAVGVAAGWLSGEDGAFLGVTFYSVYDFVGTLFINALKMLIVPLIVSSIIVGVAGIGGGGNLGRLVLGVAVQAHHDPGLQLAGVREAGVQRRGLA